MDSSKIKLAIIFMLALFGALYLGIAAATAQIEAVLWVVGGLGLTFCLVMGRRMWLMLPFTSSLGLVLPISGNFSSHLLAQTAFIGMCLVLFLMRKLPMRIKFGEMEFWCLLFLLCVTQAYMRNPVGLNIFGSSTVGGKPYALFIITVVTASLVSIQSVPPKELVWFVRLTMLGAWLNFSFGALGKVFPGIGYYMGASFATDVAQETNLSKRHAVDEGQAGRVSFVRQISTDLAAWVCCKVPPLKACFHPLWAPLIGFTLLAGAFSGFRSQFAAVALTYVVGILYRGGLRHLILSSLIVSAGLVLLGLVNLVHPLPPNVQRSLTMLPGTWEERYKDDTQQSTDWRIQMWIDALSSNRYIQNRTLGDGLGMTLEQLEKANALRDSAAVGAGGLDMHRESMMIAGDYHSGPVQTIRTVGYLGLVVLMIGLTRLAVHAHRQIMRCRDTEWYSVALFVGNVYLWYLLSWTFIIGSFSTGATMLLMGTAFIKLLENNLPLPAYGRRLREAPSIT